MITTDEMTALKNTLGLISVRGQDVPIMADCLKYLENIISREQAEQTKEETK